MTDFSEPTIGQTTPSIEQEFAAQVISGRRRVDGATRGTVNTCDFAVYPGGLTWDMHGVTVDGRDAIRWIPYSWIRHIEIEAGS